jgi:hypothetical protein
VTAVDHAASATSQSPPAIVSPTGPLFKRPMERIEAAGTSGPHISAHVYPWGWPGVSALEDRLEPQHVGAIEAPGHCPKDGTHEPQCSGWRHVGLKCESCAVADWFADVAA